MPSFPKKGLRVVYNTRQKHFKRYNKNCTSPSNSKAMHATSHPQSTSFDERASPCPIPIQLLHKKKATPPPTAAFFLSFHAFLPTLIPLTLAREASISNHSFFSQGVGKGLQVSPHPPSSPSSSPPFLSPPKSNAKRCP